MDSKLLEKLKKRYCEMVTLNNEKEKTLQVLLERKDILENSPIVRDYVDLMYQIEQYQGKSLSEEEVLHEIVTDLEYDNNYKTNSIYCYIGTFICENKNLRLVERNYVSGEFDRYVDIESLCIVDNPIEDRTIFEKENTVVVTGDVYDLHDQFIKDCIKEGQDIAINKVLSRK